MSKRKKQTGRYVVEINDWGCGTMIKDTLTGKEIDAPAEETVNLCLVEMNRLAAEVERLTKRNKFLEQIDSYLQDANQHSFEQRCNELEAEVERLRKAGDALAKTIGENGVHDNGSFHDVADSIDRWNAAKEGKPSV